MQETICIKTDYLTIIKDDIIKLHKLNKYQISFITHNIHDTSKNEIIELFNITISNMNELINDVKL